ncbi:MAG: alpha/beta fold hydrolase [Dermatophilus congolensis]|nr:alpha/beta fold hydrolase [Dermatophilus congolensis]
MTGLPNAPAPDAAVPYRSVWTYLNTVPHELFWVDCDGIRTRCLVAGPEDAPVALLLHGTAGSLENFCANYGALAKTHRVIGIDMLGCGYTDKPDRPYLIPDYAAHALSVMDTLGIGSASVVGISLGSWVAARMAADHPDRVERLVLVAPAGIIVNAEEEKEFAADVRKRRSSAAATPTWATVTEAMGRLMLDQSDLIDDLVGVRLAIYQQPEMATAMKHLLAFTTGGQELSQQEWASLRMPALVIAAVDAPNMFLDNARALGDLLPNGTVVDMRGCDHWPQFERADEFNSVMLDFLSAAVKRVAS